MRSEAAFEPYASLVAARQSQAGDRRRLVVDHVDGRPIEAVVERLGTAATDRVIVLVHGILSDRRVWH
jgi:hypothetical protein